MKIKSENLIGSALDWAVAKCEGLGDNYLKWWREGGDIRFARCTILLNYSTSWGQGGPIIEREEINLEIRESDTRASFYRMRSNFDGKAKGYGHAYGDTPLIAAMRCYVQWKLGSEIEVPDELV